MVLNPNYCSTPGTLSSKESYDSLMSELPSFLETQERTKDKRFNQRPFRVLLVWLTTFEKDIT